MKLILSILIGALLFGGTIAMAVEKHNSKLMIHHQWAKPNYGPNSAAYLTITNKSDQPYHLVNAKSPISSRVELHEHREENGIMRMRQIKQGIVIAPGTTVKFKPGGQHVMLFGVKEKFKAGDTFPLTLTFKNGETKTIDIKIKKSEGNEKHDHHHHH